MKHLIFLLFSLLLLSSCTLGKEKSAEVFSLDIPDSFSWAFESEPITVQGKPVTLAGTRLKVGDTLKDIVLDTKAPYFDTVGTGSVSQYSGYRVIETVPSLDTPVCTMQTKQLESAAKMFSDVTFVIVSHDTPFALERFCAANAIKNLVVYSDARTREFGKQNGLFLPQYWLLTRSIIIIDADMKVVYVDYAEEVTDELDLVNALAYLKSEKK